MAAMEFSAISNDGVENAEVAMLWEWTVHTPWCCSSWNLTFDSITDGNHTKKHNTEVLFLVKKIIW